MKNLLRIFASFFLLLNGIGAVVGGYKLFTAPDGHSMQLSLSLLKHSPFTDYFIPGIILFISNGLLSLAILPAVIFEVKNYPRLVTLQGAILAGWIAIQVILLQTLATLHIIWGGIGIVLMSIGWALSSIVITHRGQTLMKKNRFPPINQRLKPH